MPSQTRYTVPAIQKMRAARIGKRNERKPKILRAILFIDDVLFCIIGAITLILLLYWLNNGVFRATAPIFMTAGFFLWHISISKRIRIVIQWICFGIETVIYTLYIPVKCLMVRVADIYKKNAQAKHQKRCAKMRESYTKQQFQNIGATAENLFPISVKNRMQRVDNHAKRRKKAI
jgi:hypothetical protein